MKKYSYYFGLGDSYDEDLDVDNLYEDDDDWYRKVIESAEWTFVLYSNTELTYIKFNEMIKRCVKNIVDRNSEIFDYPYDVETYSYHDLKSIIDYDDVIFEMQELYDVEIYKSVAPMIWCDDLWENDENYDEDHPPMLWRMRI